MKKKVVLILMIVCLFCLTITPLFSGCTKRENKLLILTIDEYLNEDLIEEFQDYYKAVTGESVKVEVAYTPTNEEMYSKVAMNKADYDIIVPSDYMVEKMYNANLLLKLSDDLGTDINGNAIEDYRKNVSPYLTGDTFKSFDEVNNYACAYMWGTLGIVYNREKISTEEIKEKGWASLFPETNPGYKIQMKDSVRDTVAAAAIFTYTEQLKNGTVDINDVINYTDATHLAEIKANLIKQKKLKDIDVFVGYETDNGKTDVVEGSSDVLLQWSGDAVYTLSDEHYEEVLGEDEGPNIAYYVPTEGANVWCDYWVIPKYSVNTKAANLWINFMCSDKAAIDSMDYIGYTSSIATEATLEYANAAICWAEDDETEEAAITRLTKLDSDRFMYEDLSYFFVGIEGSDNMFIDYVQYPPKSLILNCAVMRDFGSTTQAMQDMWVEVKNA